MFTTIARHEDGQKVKILQRVNLKQDKRFTVQVVELYANGYPLENHLHSFITLEEARAFYEVAFDELKVGARIAKAEGILRRIKRKIYEYENTHEDFAPIGWIKAGRKVRRWLDRHIPHEAVDHRDWMDCYL